MDANVQEIVMSHEVELLFSKSCHQVLDVFNNVQNKIAFNPSWLLSVPVATHVHGHHVVILRDDKIHHCNNFYFAG